MNLLHSTVYGATLACSLMVISPVLGAEPMTDEEVEVISADGREFGVGVLMGSELPELDETKEPVPPEEGNNETIYLQHIVPEYGTERSDRVMEVFEESYEYPADIGVLAEQHNEQLEEGEGETAQAYRAVRAGAERDDRPVFWNEEEGFTDDTFTVANQTLDNQNPYMEAIIGECESVTYTQYEESVHHIEEIQTCQKIFQPAPNAYSCNAQRTFSVNQIESRVVGRVTPVQAAPDCDSIVAAAIHACKSDQCEAVYPLAFEVCELQSCTGLEGTEADDCSEQCQVDASAATTQCTNGPQSCGILEQHTIDHCTVVTCSDDLSPACLSGCIDLGANTGQQCQTTCAEAGDSALAQCLEDFEPGAPTTFSGSVDLAFPTIGSNTTYTEPVSESVHLLYEVVPYSVVNPANQPHYFTANHSVNVVGSGSGQVNSWGQAPTFVHQSGVSGAAISRIDVVADLFEIVENQISGCGPYMDTLADQFCEGSLQCTSGAPNCLSQGGVTICDSGPSAGLLSVLHPWHSTQVPWGSVPELAPRTCSAVTSTPLECDFHLGPAECYIAADGNEYCPEAEGLGFEAFLGPEPYVDDCRTLHERPECTQLRTQCAEDGDGPVTERCYVPDVVYDCGYQIVTESEVARETEIQCDTPVRCMGTECVSMTTEPNASQDALLEASAVLSHMGMDSTCLELNPDENESPDPDNCTVTFFRGEAQECKVPIGANLDLTPDCCKEGLDAAEDVGFAEYYEALSGSYQATMAPSHAQVQAGASGRENEQGSAIDTPDPHELRERLVDPDDPDSEGDSETTFRNLVDDTFRGPRNLPYGPAASDEANYVSRPFRTPFEVHSAQYGYNPNNPEKLGEAKAAAGGTGWPNNESTSGDGGTSRSSDLLYPAAMGLAVRKHLLQTQGELLADALFSPGGFSNLSMSSFSDTGKNLTKAASGAYMSYRILQAIGHFVFQCEEEEIELGTRRKSLSCTYVGKYCRRRAGVGPLRTCVETREVFCCFNSPFSRIMVEQMRAADGDDFGSPKSPSCEGYPVHEITQRDFTTLDLSEWTALMKDSEMVPGAGESSEWRWTEEASTPKRAIAGRPNVEGEGPDGTPSASQRTEQRLAQNIGSMEASREVLEQRGTAYHDPELMPWYYETTHTGNPPAASDDPDIGDDIGDPTVPPDYSCPDPPQGWVQVTHSDTGEPLSPVQFPDIGAPPIVQSYPVTSPPTGYIALPMTIASNQDRGTVDAFTGMPPHSNVSPLRLSINRCPGTFPDPADDPGCSITIAGSGAAGSLDFSSAPGAPTYMCQLVPGRTYFVNLTVMMDDTNSGCSHQEGCESSISIMTLR